MRFGTVKWYLGVFDITQYPISSGLNGTGSINECLNSILVNKTSDPKFSQESRNIKINTSFGQTRSSQKCEICEIFPIHILILYYSHFHIPNILEVIIVLIDSLTPNADAIFIHFDTIK